MLLGVADLLVLMDGLGPRIWLRSIILSAATRLPIVRLRLVVVLSNALAKVDLHYVADITLSLGISVLHGVHQGFNILLVRCIRWKQLKFMIVHICVAILIPIISCLRIDVFLVLNYLDLRVVFSYGGRSFSFYFWSRLWLFEV